MGKTILGVTILSCLVLSGCAYQINSQPTVQEKVEVNQQTKTVEKQKDNIITKETKNCTKLADLPNEYGCHPSMQCNDDQVCREGNCVAKLDAPDAYGCNPLMQCDDNQVCREGVCVASKDAPDKYGCNPLMKCGDNEVCREGNCISVCKE